MTHHAGRTAHWLPAVCGAIALIPSMLPGQTVPLPRTDLHSLVSSKSVGNGNRNDLRAAIKVWSDAMARQKGFELDSDIYIADTVSDIRARLESHSVDVLVLSVPECLDLESSRLVVPELAHDNALGPAPHVPGAAPEKE
jgi:hypothetical protein